jgi:RNA polymerase sigma-70 factor (ECF subfamily)
VAQTTSDPTDHARASASSVEQARQGDREAFARLVRENQASVRAMVGRFVRDVDLADDVAQEVFVAAHRGLAAFRAETSFRGWLFAIARRQIALHFREHLRERATSDDELEEGLHAWMAERGLAPEVGPHAGADDTEQRLAALRACLAGLPGEHAALVASYYFGARPAAELARGAGKSVDALRMAMMRIRRALRSCVQSKLGEAQT